MNCTKRRTVICLFYLIVASIMSLGSSPRLQAQEKRGAAEEPAKSRRVGTIKSLNGSKITLQPDSGPDIAVVVQDSTRMVRVPPGEKDLSNASPIQLQDLQTGDRMLVRGKLCEEDQVFLADLLVVIKRADIADKRQHDRQEWQQKSVGGIVSALNSGDATITISVMPGVSVKIKTSQSTNFLRYARGSVKFADAKRSSFGEIRVGDQLRARGNRSTDNKELSAESVISGTFRNIAGLVLAVDPSANTITVSDLLTRKPVLVNISRNSLLRKLTPNMAQMAVALLRQSAPGPSSSPAGSGERSFTGQGAEQTRQVSSATAGSATPPDFSRMLGAVPPAKLGDLQKGDAVMIVSEEIAEKESSAVTAIIVVDGVEPVLRAMENGAGAAILSRWTFSSALATDD